MNLSLISEALEDLKRGKMIIVIDDEDRENEGDLIMAAQFANSENINFMITHGKGLICAPLSAQKAKDLELPLMVVNNESSFETAFTISVDYKFGVTTGISTHERALTLRSLANANHGADDFKRPGHIFPLIGKEGGVRIRPGHTEAAIDLCKLAELEPVGVICEILGDDGECLRLKDLLTFSKKFNLKIITIADLIDYQNEGNNSFLDKGENYATH